MNIMGLEEYKGVYVFAQQVDNVLDGVAFELLGKAKDLAKDLDTDVTAVLIGSDVNGATAIGRDLGPTVSARVATGLTADCTVLEIGDFPLVAQPGKEDEQKHKQLLMTRPAFGGNTIATIACPDNRPQMYVLALCRKSLRLKAQKQTSWNSILALHRIIVT